MFSLGGLDGFPPNNAMLALLPSLSGKALLNDHWPGEGFNVTIVTQLSCAASGMVLHGHV